MNSTDYTLSNRAETSWCQSLSLLYLCPITSGSNLLALSSPARQEEKTQRKRIVKRLRL